MEITHDFLDLAEYEARQLLPATIVPRVHGEKWLVRDLPLGAVDGAHAEWSYSAEGEAVRVPLFPYICNGVEPVVAMAFAFELGINARQIIPNNYIVKRAHISIGNPVQQITSGEANTLLLRFWAGVGFVVTER